MKKIRTIDLRHGDTVQVRVDSSEDGPLIDAANAAEVDVLRRQISVMQNAHEEAMQRMEGIYRERLRAAMELASAAEKAFPFVGYCGGHQTRDPLASSIHAFRGACRRA